MTQTKTTPMLRQYMAAKEQYPDAILFFRMGDFYEMFFEDARTASRALEITLTSRNKNDPDPIPMAGVPHHSADRYIARLIEQGYKVAICDQVEDPSQARGIVRREVVRVVTPGVVTDAALLDAKAENWLTAVYLAKKKVGIASMDVSTGAFLVTEAEDPGAAAREMARIRPREVLTPKSLAGDPALEKILDTAGEAARSPLDDEDFQPARARKRLAERFGDHALKGFGILELSAGIAACGSVLAYVAHTQKQQAPHVARITPYRLDNHLWLDGTTTRNLELFENIVTGTRKGTLLSVLDKTVTSMGGRLLRHWLGYPLLAPDAINERLDAVAEARDKTLVRQQAREILTEVYDVERLRTRVCLGQANARDLTALKVSLSRLPALFSLLLEHFSSDLLTGPEAADDLADVFALIDEAISEEAPVTLTEGGIIRQGYNGELDELTSLATNAKGAIAAMEATEKQKTGIASLKVKYNKVFGYYIEVPKAHAEKVPPDYVRKQTLVNAERYITDELKKFEDRVLGAEERQADLEYALFQEVRDKVLAHDARIEAAAGKIALADAILALAECADANDYVRPEILESGVIEIEEGRHPVVEKTLPGGRYVPNSLTLDNAENQVLIITGPNMAGKSTVLRQAAAFVILAQMGSFVPAASARIGIVDRIFTRVGALDNLSQGQSTFMVEMQETANILNNVTERSLVVLDEIGRGTSTFDGLSIAWAVAEYLHDVNKRGVKTLFATHYHELTDLAKTLPRVKNFHIAVREWNDEVIFLHTLAPGGTNKSHGIAVARMAGVPAPVLKRARKVLAEIEASDAARVNRSPEVKKQRVKEAAVQLTLFPTPEELVVQALEKLDVNAMTPLEAINTLAMLKEKIVGRDEETGTGEEPLEAKGP